MLQNMTWRGWVAAAVVSVGALASVGASAAPQLYTSQAAFTTAVSGAGIALATEDFSGLSVDHVGLPAVQRPGFVIAIGTSPDDGDPNFVVANDDPQYCFGTCVTASFGRAGGFTLDISFDSPVHAASLLLGNGLGQIFAITADSAALDPFTAPGVSLPPDQPGFDFLGVFDPIGKLTTLRLSFAEPIGDFEIENVSFDRSVLVAEPSSLSLLLAGLALAGWRARRRRAAG